MIKNAGWLGLAMVAWSMWKAGVLVPYFNDYQPHAFAAEMVPNMRAEEELIVGITVDAYKLTGTPFDGADIGGVFGPVFATGGFSSPPDPTLCVVTLAAERPKCLLKPREGRQTSYCVNAYACEWSVPLPEGELFALVTFDVDHGILGGSWDFIDAVIIIKDPTQAEFDRINRSLDLFISYMSPTYIAVADNAGADRVEFDRQERFRREKPLQFLTPEEAAQPGGVRLVQSGIQLAFTN